LGLPGFPLTSAVPEQALKAPTNPFGASCARLEDVTSSARHFVRTSEPVRVGRDPALCAIVLAEPRVSAVHAQLRFAEGALWVCDEGSNNGSTVDGAQLLARSWTRVLAGSTLGFGPVSFKVVVE
jgi:predicted component of type VI protein secretion system